MDAEANISASAILLVFSSTAGLFNFFPDSDLISQFGYLYHLKSASSHPGGALGSCGYWTATFISALLLTSYVILEKSFWMQFSKALLKVRLLLLSYFSLSERCSVSLSSVCLPTSHPNGLFRLPAPWSTAASCCCFCVHAFGLTRWDPGLS